MYTYIRVVCILPAGGCAVLVGPSVPRAFSSFEEKVTHSVPASRGATCVCSVCTCVRAGLVLWCAMGRSSLLGCISPEFRELETTAFPSGGGGQAASTARGVHARVLPYCAYLPTVAGSRGDNSPGAKQAGGGRVFHYHDNSVPWGPITVTPNHFRF